MCPQCMQAFKPKRGGQRYCSRACVMGNARAVLAEMHEAGEDPRHGGEKAENRRAALAKLKAEGRAPTVPPSTKGSKRPRKGPEPEPSEPTIREQADAYRDAGQRWGVYAQGTLEGQRRSTLVLAGYGASISVRRDALVVREGHTHSPQEPAEHVLYKWMHNVSRIICLDTRGSLSFEAVRWCAQQKITVLLVDSYGHLYSCLTPESDADVLLRQQQYELGGQRTAGIAKALVTEKLRGQLGTLESHIELPGGSEASLVVRTYLERVEEMRTDQMPGNVLAAIRGIEGAAAAAYFEAWKGLPLRWKSADRRRVAPHWLVVRERFSPINPRLNRKAIDPTNALLNYAYGVLEGQCRTALAAYGFDVTCGILHVSRDYRDSLVYDLMESFRPKVDALVLDFICSSTFQLGDFTKVSDGSIRLHPQLARSLVATCKVEDRRISEGAASLRDSVVQRRPKTTVR